MMYTNNNNGNTFLKFLGEVAPLEFKNTSRIILGSKSEKLRITRLIKKLGIPAKKSVFCSNKRIVKVPFWYT